MVRRVFKIILSARSLIGWQDIALISLVDIVVRKTNQSIAIVIKDNFSLWTLPLVLKTFPELQNVATSTPLNRRIYDTSGEELEEKDEYRGDKSKHGEVIRKDWFESHISRAINEPDDSGMVIFSATLGLHSSPKTLPYPTGTRNRKLQDHKCQ